MQEKTKEGSNPSYSLIDEEIIRSESLGRHKPFRSNSLLNNNNENVTDHTYQESKESKEREDYYKDNRLKENMDKNYLNDLYNEEKEIIDERMESNDKTKNNRKDEFIRTEKKRTTISIKTSALEKKISLLEEENERLRTTLGLKEYPKSSIRRASCHSVQNYPSKLNIPSDLSHLLDKTSSDDPYRNDTNILLDDNESSINFSSTLDHLLPQSDTIENKELININKLGNNIKNKKLFNKSVLKYVCSERADIILKMFYLLNNNYIRYNQYTNKLNNQDIDYTNINTNTWEKHKIWDDNCILNIGITGWDILGPSDIIFFYDKLYNHIFSNLRIMIISLKPQTDDGSAFLLKIRITGTLVDANSILVHFPTLYKIIDNDLYFKFIYNKNIDIYGDMSIFFNDNMNNSKIIHILITWNPIKVMKQIFGDNVEKLWKKK